MAPPGVVLIPASNQRNVLVLVEFLQLDGSVGVDYHLELGLDVGLLEAGDYHEGALDGEEVEVESCDVPRGGLEGRLDVHLMGASLELPGLVLEHRGLEVVVGLGQELGHVVFLFVGTALPDVELVDVLGLLLLDLVLADAESDIDVPVLLVLFSDFFENDLFRELAREGGKGF